MITMPAAREREIQYAIETADCNGVRVNLVPDFNHRFGTSFHVYNIDDQLPVIKREIPLDRFNSYFFKRIFDVLFALTALIFLAPVFLVIAILIKINSKGPILYKPIRQGQYGKEFACFKFRTMYADQGDDPRNGTRSTVKEDPRITRVGKFLRKRDIDELPQFLNC